MSASTGISLAPLPFTSAQHVGNGPAVGSSACTLPQPEVEHPFKTALAEVWSELEALDAAQIESVNLATKSYSLKAISEEIHTLNKEHDPICRLIRIDALATYMLLREDSRFRHLAYRTALFNVSRDAAMRLKVGKQIEFTLLPLFQEFKGMYGLYVSNKLFEKGDFSLVELIRLYMHVLTWNITLLGEYECYDFAYFEIPAPSIPCASIQEAILYLRASHDKGKSDDHDTFRRMQTRKDMLPPRIVFLPTFVDISIKTMLKAWGAGIIFINCSSKVNAHFDYNNWSPAGTFIHDEIYHLPPYLKKIEQISEKQFSCMQNNACKILAHLGELRKKNFKLNQALERVLFDHHHEYGYIFLENELTKVPEAYFDRHRWTSEHKEAFKYYLTFASQNFE